LTGELLHLVGYNEESANLHQGVQFEPKVIRDSNPDFWINPNSGCLPDRSQNIVDSLRIGVSHFAECRENGPVMRNAN